MATQLQIRRGTAAQVAAFTGAEGEIVYNSTNDSLHTNDGATAGGFELARADLNNVSDADLNAALTGNTLSALTITTLTSEAATFSDSVTLLKTTADANLQVQTTFAGADARLNLYGNSTGTSQIRFGDEASVNVGLLTYNHADDSLTARVGGSDALTIDASGRVLIGTDTGDAFNDDAVLRLGKSGERAFLQFKTNGSDNSGILFGTEADDVRQQIIYEADDDALTFRGNTNEAMRLDASGNLGLGGSTITDYSGTSFLINASAGSAARIKLTTATSGTGITNGGGITYDTGNNLSLLNRELGSIIFYTNNTDVGRIDANGNLLLGTTDDTVWNNTAGNGINLRGDLGLIASARTNAESAMFNRMGTDGEVIKINKNGATVGSIGAKSGDIYIGTGDTGIRFNDTDNAVYGADTTTGSASDGNISLGVSSARFKDLYLSGNANVGSVVASGSVISPFFSTGSFSYSSGTTAIITIPQDSIYLFMSRPNNYGGSDNRHGAVYIIRRWGSSVGSTELAASAAGRGVFTIATGGTVSYGSTGAGVPSTAIYWIRIA